MLNGVWSDLVSIAKTLTPSTFVFFGFLNVEFLGGDFTYILMFFWVMFSLFDVILGLSMKNANVNWHNFLRWVGEKMSLIIWFFFVIMFIGAINYKVTNEGWSMFMWIISLLGIILGVMGEFKSNIEKRPVIITNRNWLISIIGRLMKFLDKRINLRISRQEEKYLDGVKVKK